MPGKRHSRNKEGTGKAIESIDTFLYDENSYDKQEKMLEEGDEDGVYHYKDDWEYTESDPMKKKKEIEKGN